jgi:hypothetical protein
MKNKAMSQVVIEFGSPSFGPVFDALLSLIGRPTAIDMESRSGGREALRATKDTREAIAKKFADGQVASATFRPESGGVRYGLILEPRYKGQDLSVWMGTVELMTDDWRPYWDALLLFDALVFVCVGEEEGVELNDDNLNVDSFPWDEWPLLIGALRAEGGSRWAVKERTTPRQSHS